MTRLPRTRVCRLAAGEVKRVQPKQVLWCVMLLLLVWDHVGLPSYLIIEAKMLTVDPQQ